MALTGFVSSSRENLASRTYGQLREALMAGGEPAVVDVFVLMGGIKIFVPVNWTVSQEVVALLGGVQDKTRSISSNPAQHLLVRGTAVMGGVEISN